MELIKNPDYKYIRALGLFYYRLVETRPENIYKVLEPHYADLRRLVFREVSGKCEIKFMDQFVD